LPVKFGNFLTKIKTHEAVPVEKDTNNTKRDLFAVVLTGAGVASHKFLGDVVNIDIKALLEPLSNLRITVCRS